MTLLDAPAEKPAKSRAMAFTLGVVAIIMLVVLYYSFRFYPEENAARHLFGALVAGDAAKAYELWKPGPGSSYGMKDFVADWGSQGYYGPVKSYQIVRSSWPGCRWILPHFLCPNSSGAIVEVRISPFSPMPDESDPEKNRKTRVVSVWVESKDKSFSFPP
jgi:hypothetical protein